MLIFLVANRTAQNRAEQNRAERGGIACSCSWQRLRRCHFFIFLPGGACGAAFSFKRHNRDGDVTGWERAVGVDERRNPVERSAARSRRSSTAATSRSTAPTLMIRLRRRGQGLADLPPAENPGKKERVPGRGGSARRAVSGAASSHAPRGCHCEIPLSWEGESTLQLCVCEKQKCLEKVETVSKAPGIRKLGAEGAAKLPTRKAQHHIRLRLLWRQKETDAGRTRTGRGQCRFSQQARAGLPPSPAPCSSRRHSELLDPILNPSLGMFRHDWLGQHRVLTARAQHSQKGGRGGAATRRSRGQRRGRSVISGGLRVLVLLLTLLGLLILLVFLLFLLLVLLFFLVLRCLLLTRALLLLLLLLVVAVGDRRHRRGGAAGAAFALPATLLLAPRQLLEEWSGGCGVGRRPPQQGSMTPDHVYRVVARSAKFARRTCWEARFGTGRCRPHHHARQARAAPAGACLAPGTFGACGDPRERDFAGAGQPPLVVCRGEEFGVRSLQRGAGTDSACHEQRLGSAGDTALPVFLETETGGSKAPDSRRPAPPSPPANRGKGEGGIRAGRPGQSARARVPPILRGIVTLTISSEMETPIHTTDNSRGRRGGLAKPHMHQRKGGPSSWLRRSRSRGVRPAWLGKADRIPFSDPLTERSPGNRENQHSPPLPGDNNESSFCARSPPRGPVTKLFRRKEGTSQDFLKRNSFPWLPPPAVF
eukprot:gene108-biopygen12054